MLLCLAVHKAVSVDRGPMRALGDILLRKSPVPPPMDVVDLPHTDKGPRDAPAVVLLHGFPLDHTMWAAPSAALEAAGFRVLAPDLRGAGKAPLGKGPATMEAHAADVLRLAERAGIRRFALAGFSLGGYVALELVRASSEHVSALLLIDTRAGSDSPEARAARYQTIEKVRGPGGVAVVAEAMLPKLLTLRASEEMRQKVNGVMLAQRVEGVVSTLQGMAERPDQRPHLARIVAPTLVVVGEEDTLTPPEESEMMAKAIPNAKLVRAKGAHLTPVESAEDVSYAMVTFLRSSLAGR